VGSLRLTGWLKGIAGGAVFVAMLAVPLVGQGAGKVVFNDTAQGSGSGASKVPFQDLQFSNVSQQDLNVVASTGTVIKKVTLSYSYRVI
jgi:hypothetical protein